MGSHVGYLSRRRAGEFRSVFSRSFIEFPAGSRLCNIAVAVVTFFSLPRIGTFTWLHRDIWGLTWLHKAIWGLLKLYIRLYTAFLKAT